MGVYCLGQSQRQSSDKIDKRKQRWTQRQWRHRRPTNMATSGHPVPTNYQMTSSVPMRQDSQSFEERQKMIWEDMHERMERRRREWDGEVVHVSLL